jgi:hypothetical protein
MKRMDVDSIVGQWTIRAANRYSRRGFMARAGAVMGGVVAAPVLRDAMFPGRRASITCGSEYYQDQRGESIMCTTLNGNNNCISGQTWCGCWTTCPSLSGQEGVKCVDSSNNQYYITFSDCSMPNSTCYPGYDHPKDVWGNSDSCINPCQWPQNNNYHVQCRFYGCGSSICS